MTTLAEFLRARREALRPADVGLPDHGRRRTPGLRREEVATLAGVSVDYLIRLEQGRDTHPSASVLMALADALRLDEDDRVHLKRLGAISVSQGLCPSAQPPNSDVAPTVMLLLDRLDPTPAFVLGPFSDVLAGNDAWERLVAPLGMLDGAPPNLARYVFLDPTARTTYPDWEAAADEQVNQLRAATAYTNQVGGSDELRAELQVVPEFADRWSRVAMSEKHRGTRALIHPDLGRLEIAYEVMILPSDGEQRLITWLPADDATASALVPEPVSPARLRAIG